MRLARDAGLDQAETEKVLRSDMYEAEVRADEKEAKLNDIHMVPYFLINDKESISGAADLKEMKSMILKYLMV